MTNAPKAMGMTSDTTANIIQEMSYVGGITYAKTRLLEATGTRVSGMARKVRPPALLTQTAAAGPHGTSRSASPSSEATSRRSSAYKAVHEAAIARKALLEAQFEAEQTIAGFSADKTECNREHQTIAAEIEAIQNELRLSTERQAQRQGKQAAEMNAMGQRWENLLIQRELRMESQKQEMCSQIQTMGTMLREIHPRTENMIPMVPTRNVKDLPSKLSSKNVTLKYLKKTQPSPWMQQNPGQRYPNTNLNKVGSKLKQH